MLSNHKKFSKSDSIKTKMDYDATSLYPSAIWDENSVSPQIETGSAFMPNMNDVYVEAFNIRTFLQDADETAILRRKYYNPPYLIFQHLPVRES